MVSFSLSYKRCVRLVLLAAALSLSSVSSFAPPLQTRPRQSKQTHVSLFGKPKNKYTQPTMMTTASMTNQSSSSSASSASTLALPTATVLGSGALLFEALGSLSSLPTPSPFVVSELLTDASHVALDLITFLGPSTAVVRLAAVIGRILCVLADYLPDGFMNPEEVVFQAFMLLVATIGLLQVMLPPMWTWTWTLLLAGGKEAHITVRDGKAFKAWAKGAGMTWEQYKALVVVGALEWKELRPQESLQVKNNNGNNNNNNHNAEVYWLYKGQVQIDRKSNISNKNHAQVIRRQVGHGLRQVDGAQHLDLQTFKATTSTTVKSNDKDESIRITADPTQGATLLVCNMDRLTAVLRHDNTLRDAWKNILWQGLQDQLADAYHYHHQQQPDKAGP